MNRPRLLQLRIRARRSPAEGRQPTIVEVLDAEGTSLGQLPVHKVEFDFVGSDPGMFRVIFYNARAELVTREAEE